MKSSDPLKTIRLTDGTFATRLLRKYGWVVGQATIRDGMVHPEHSANRKSFFGVQPIHVSISRTYQVMPLHVKLTYMYTEFLRLIHQNHDKLQTPGMISSSTISPSRQTGRTLVQLGKANKLAKQQLPGDRSKVAQALKSVEPVRVSAVSQVHVVSTKQEIVIPRGRIRLPVHLQAILDTIQTVKQELETVRVVPVAVLSPSRFTTQSSSRLSDWQRTQTVLNVPSSIKRHADFAQSVRTLEPMHQSVNSTPIVGSRKLQRINGMDARPRQVNDVQLVSEKRQEAKALVQQLSMTKQLNNAMHRTSKSMIEARLVNQARITNRTDELNQSDIHNRTNELKRTNIHSQTNETRQVVKVLRQQLGEAKELNNVVHRTVKLTSEVRLANQVRITNRMNRTDESNQTDIQNRTNEQNQTNIHHRTNEQNQTNIHHRTDELHQTNVQHRIDELKQTNETRQVVKVLRKQLGETKGLNNVVHRKVKLPSEVRLANQVRITNRMNRTNESNQTDIHHRTDELNQTNIQNRTDELKQMNETRQVVKVLRQQLGETKELNNVVHRKVKLPSEVRLANQVRITNRMNRTNESNQTDIHSRTNEQNQTNIHHRTDELNIQNRTDELKQMNETRQVVKVIRQQLGETKELNNVVHRKVKLPSEVRQANQLRITNRLNRTNELNQTNIHHRTDELHQTNIQNHTNESKQTNETRQVVKVLRQQLGETKQMNNVVHRKVKLTSEMRLANQVRITNRTNEQNQTNIHDRTNELHQTNIKHRTDELKQTDETRQVLEVLRQQLGETKELNNVVQRTVQLPSEVRLANQVRITNRLNRTNEQNRSDIQSQTDVHHRTNKLTQTNIHHRTDELHQTSETRQVVKVLRQQLGETKELNKFVHRTINVINQVSTKRQAVVHLQGHQPTVVDEQASTLRRKSIGTVQERERVGVVAMTHRRTDQPVAGSAVTTKKLQTTKDVPLELLVKPSLREAPQKELIKSLETAIRTVENDLNQAKVQWSKPSLDMKRLADQMYREFSHRIRFEQQRRGL